MPVLDLDLKTSTAPIIFSDLPAWEVQLNSIVLEPGWLAASQIPPPNLVKYRDWANSNNPNFKWRKWGETQLLCKAPTANA